MLQEMGPRIDVLVLQPRLPDGDGAEILGRLRARGCGARTLVLDARSEPSDVARLVAAGASGVVDRRAGLRDVVDAVRRLGQGEALLSYAQVHEFSRAAVRRHEREREERARLRRLTAREKEILDALTRGLSDREISAELFITEGTVRQHTTRLLAKLEVASRLKAALLGLRRADPEGPGDG